MKNYIKFMLLFMICFACQNDDITNVEETLTNEAEIVNTNALPSLTLNSIYRKPSDSELLENKMQWAAFLSKEALRSDNNARKQFNKILNFRSRVKLSDLLINDGFLATPFFLNAFRAQFDFYDQYKRQAFVKPRGEPSLPKDPDNNNCHDCPPPYLPTQDERFTNLVTYLIEQNCLEFYFPNGYNYRNNESVSTAHPLNLELFNEAYDHKSEFIINNFNLSNLENVIIIRPVRPTISFTNNPCYYKEYSDIDFIDFLSK